jgi:Zn-dependent peptidase ImmA (M78 family)/DNA-binding XRE family transcriptional regulator
MTTDSLSDNIRRLMKSQGITIRALAEKTGISTVSLSNLLNNKVVPKTQTIIKISGVLHSSMDDLFRAVPQFQSLRFRPNSSISAREIALRDIVIINATKWINDYCNLENELIAIDPAFSKKAKYSLETLHGNQPEATAFKVRKLWEIGNNPIRNITELVEDSGIKLWLRDFSMQKIFGFSIGEADGGPAIVINTNVNISAERQTFAIAHELGHILMHPASFAPSKSSKEEKENTLEEAEAHRFAAELLLPKEAFKIDWNKNLAVPFVPRVILVKKKYSVSYKTVLKHFADAHATVDVYSFFYIRYKTIYNLNINGRRELESVRPEWVSKRELDSNPTDNYLKSNGYISVVYKGYKKGIIPNESKLGDILQCSFDQATSLAREWNRKEIFAESL